MNLKEFLSPECIVLLRSTTKADALGELATLAAEHGAGPDAESLLAALHKREEMMSTGIGQGLAVPHVRMKEVPKPMVAVGVSRVGLADYKSLDDQPVHIMLMILAPAGQHETYVRLLAQAAEALKHEDRRAAIIAAEKPTAAYELLTGDLP